jgi:parafibromin
MFNIRSLLERSEYARPDELKAAGAQKEGSLSLEHTFEDGTSVSLVVIDNPTARLAAHEWAHVVGCVAQGSTWQFKGWPFPHGEVEIFSKMAGFHFRFSDEIPNQKTKGWALTNLVFSREKTRRHEVGVSMTTFWQKLHQFLKVNKPHLLRSAKSR